MHTVHTYKKSYSLNYDMPIDCEHPNHKGNYKTYFEEFGSVMSQFVHTKNMVKSAVFARQLKPNT